MEEESYLVNSTTTRIKPTKILICGLTEYMGGIESYVSIIIRFFCDSNDNYEFNFLIKGFKSTPVESQISNITKNKCKFYYIPNLRNNFAKCIYLLNKIYDSEIYDFIYINASYSSDIIFVWPFIRNSKTKIIMHSHTSNSDTLKWRFKNIIFRWVARTKTDAKIACSTQAAKWMFGTADSVNIIHNGIDVERYRYSEKNRQVIRKFYNIKENEFVIGHIGRFVKVKNHMFILYVLRDLLNYKLRIKVLFMGEGNLKQNIEEMARNMKLLDSVIFVNNQENVEMFYSAFDAFVLPSLFEGFPYVGIEAQASGLPCFFSDKMDSDVIITDRTEMLPIRKHDVSLWANKIIAGIRNNNNNNRDNYYQKVLKAGFDVQTMCGKVREVLKDY